MLGTIREYFKQRELLKRQQWEEANHCPEGDFHEWDNDVICDPCSMSGIIDYWYCIKCGETERV